MKIQQYCEQTMNTTIQMLISALALLALSTLNLQLSVCFAQGTAFTYQGRLNSGGGAASGAYDLTFGLFATNAVAVSNGLFTVMIDFGTNIFTTLTPRQPLTPTPYAIFASTANNLSGTLPVAQLSGLILDNQLNHSAVTYNPGPGLSGGGPRVVQFGLRLQF